MIKFIVFWTVINVFSVPCGYEPTPDEFGRMPSNWAIPAVACWDTDEVEQSREFDTFSEALAFVARWKTENKSPYWNDGTMKDFRIVKSQEVASFKHDPPVLPEIEPEWTILSGGMEITFESSEGSFVTDVDPGKVIRELVESIKEDPESLESQKKALEE